MKLLRLLFPIIMFLLSNFTFASSDIFISEVYFEGAYERIEISNRGNSNFSGSIEISGASNNLITLNNFSINQGESIVISSQSVNHFIDTGNILFISNTLILADDGSINLSLFYNGQLIDKFDVDENIVHPFVDGFNSFERVKLNGNYVITICTGNRQLNVLSGIIANPGFVFEINIPVIDIEQQNYYTGFSFGDLMVSEIFFDGTNERIEVYNNTVYDFYGNLFFSGVKNGLLSVYNVFIPSYGFGIFGDTLNFMSISGNIYSGLALSISDTTGINVSMSIDSILLDQVFIPSILVNSINNLNSSIHLFLGDFIWTGVDIVHSNLSGSLINPGFIYLSNSGTGNSSNSSTGNIITGNSCQQVPISFEEINFDNSNFSSYIEMVSNYSGFLEIQFLYGGQILETFSKNIISQERIVFSNQDLGLSKVFNKKVISQLNFNSGFYILISGSNFSGSYFLDQNILNLSGSYLIFKNGCNLNYNTIRQASPGFDGDLIIQNYLTGPSSTTVYISNPNISTTSCLNSGQLSINQNTNSGLIIQTGLTMSGQILTGKIQSGSINSGYIISGTIVPLSGYFITGYNLSGIKLFFSGVCYSGKKLSTKNIMSTFIKQCTKSVLKTNSTTTTTDKHLFYINEVHIVDSGSLDFLVMSTNRQILTGDYIIDQGKNSMPFKYPIGTGIFELELRFPLKRKDSCIDLKKGTKIIDSFCYVYDDNKVKYDGKLDLIFTGSKVCAYYGDKQLCKNQKYLTGKQQKTALEKITTSKIIGKKIVTKLLPKKKSVKSAKAKKPKKIDYKSLELQLYKNYVSSINKLYREKRPFIYYYSDFFKYNELFMDLKKNLSIKKTSLNLYGDDYNVINFQEIYDILYSDNFLNILIKFEYLLSQISIKNRDQ